MTQPEPDSPSTELPLVAPLRQEPRPTTSESQPIPILLSKVTPISPKASPKRILGVDIENGTRWGWGPHGFTHSIIYCITTKTVGTPDDAVATYWIDWRADDETIRSQLAPMFDADRHAQIASSATTSLTTSKASRDSPATCNSRSPRRSPSSTHTRISYPMMVLLRASRISACSSDSARSRICRNGTGLMRSSGRNLTPSRKSLTATRPTLC